MKAKVINTLKHDGTVYEKGSTFEGDAELVKRLIKDGVLRDKDAVEQTSEEEAQVLIINAKAEGEKIVNDAKAEADKILDGARKKADDTVTAAKNLGAQITEDAKAEADKIVADAKAKAAK